MTLDTKDRDLQLPSVGIDAVDLARYSHVTTNDGDLLIYDEDIQDAWFQSSLWIPIDTMQ